MKFEDTICIKKEEVDNFITSLKKTIEEIIRKNIKDDFKKFEKMIKEAKYPIPIVARKGSKENVIALRKIEKVRKKLREKIIGKSIVVEDVNLSLPRIIGFLLADVGLRNNYTTISPETLRVCLLTFAKVKIINIDFYVTKHGIKYAFRITFPNYLSLFKKHEYLLSFVRKMPRTPTILGEFLAGFIDGDGHVYSMTGNTIQLGVKKSAVRKLLEDIFGNYITYKDEKSLLLNLSLCPEIRYHIKTYHPNRKLLYYDEEILNYVHLISEAKVRKREGEREFTTKDGRRKRIKYRFIELILPKGYYNLAKKLFPYVSLSKDKVIITISRKRTRLNFYKSLLRRFRLQNVDNSVIKKLEEILKFLENPQTIPLSDF